MTPEQRKRVSEGHKGQKPWNKGKKTGKSSWNKGIAMSEESKQKMILSKKNTKLKEYTCSICNNKSFSKTKNQMYCSDPCKKEAVKRHRKKPEVREKLRNYKSLYKKRPDVIKKWEEEGKAKDIQRSIKWRGKKRKEDPNFRLMDNLRRNVNRALKSYTKTGKIMSSKKYGINYGKVIQHLMNNKPPGVTDEELFDFKKWHVDHIYPVSKFNLNDPEEVKIAFAPENHQWLTAEENMKKGDSTIGVRKAKSPQKSLKEFKERE